MYSYQKTTAKTSLDSFVPKRTSTLELVDNRPKTITQRKALSAIHKSNVIQLGKNQDHKKKKDPFARPTFTTDSKKSAMLYHNTFGKHSFKINLKKPNLTGLNAAQPHRLAWKDISRITEKHHKGQGSSGFNNMTKMFIGAGLKRIARIQKRVLRYKKFGNAGMEALAKRLLKRSTNSQSAFVKALNDYVGHKSETNLKAFLKQANSFHANVPDYGPHFGVNQPVSAAIHLNFRRSRTRKRTSKGRRGRSPSPMSRAILENLSKQDVSAGIAVDKNRKIITTSGKLVRLSSLSAKVKADIAKFHMKQINSFDSKAPFGSKYVKD